MTVRVMYQGNDLFPEPQIVDYPGGKFKIVTSESGKEAVEIWTWCEEIEKWRFTGRILEDAKMLSVHILDDEEEDEERDSSV